MPVAKIVLTIMDGKSETYTLYFYIHIITYSSVNKNCGSTCISFVNRLTDWIFSVKVLNTSEIL